MIVTLINASGQMRTVKVGFSWTVFFFGFLVPLYRGDVNKMLDYLINSALLEVGKNPSAMTKEDKMRIVELLDRRGAFLITKSGSKVCDVLNISKFTLYNYLETIRKESGQK